ncbi:MAG: sugar transferase [Hyphomonadaceae bacterium]
MSYESFLEETTQASLVTAAGITAEGEEGLGAPYANPSWGKRLFDLAVAIPVFLFVIPLVIVIALAVKLSDGGQVVFSHRRRGQNGRMFNCYKFRSMVPDADVRLQELLEEDAELADEWARDQKLRNDPRITSFGKFLRKTSLDELPQLINIFRGEMSVVGPRPIVENEVARYGDDIEAYDTMPPGVTGLWQVNGRNNTTYAERVAMDTEYARTYSIWLDIKILFQTIPAILFSRGAY